MAQTNRLRSLGEGEIGESVPDPALLFGQPPSPPPQPTAPPQRLENAATTMLLTSLRALSQRTVVALANLFVLATVASAWWLWYVTMPAPNTSQLVGLALYGVLILALNWLVLRRS